MTWSAGMTRKGEGIAGSTVMTGSVEMRVDTEVAPEACNSSPGNANRLLAHKRVMTKAVTQIHCGNMPCDIPPKNIVLTCLLPIGRLAFPGWRILCVKSKHFGVKPI